MTPVKQQCCSNPKFTRFFFGNLVLKQPPVTAAVPRSLEKLVWLIRG
jgi:hypothetical protein